MKINDKITEHMNLLGIDKYPFTSKTLNECFKKTIMIYHPDKYKGKDATEKATQIIQSYNELKSYTNDIEKVIVEKKMFEFTKPCSHCEGSGYVMKSVRVEGYDCIKCKDTGIVGVLFMLLYRKLKV